MTRDSDQADQACSTAARAGQKGEARRLWDQANAVAERLPRDFYDPLTSFSRVNMGVHAVTTAVELRQGGDSKRQATRNPQFAVPPQPRRGRHLIEVARAHHLNSDVTAALGSLGDAYATAPETIRYNEYARRILLKVTVEDPSQLRRQADDLADRIGLLV